MADARFHPHQSASPCDRGSRRQSGHEPHKRGLNTKLYLSVDSHGMPVRFVLSEGSAADCHHAPALMTEIPADYLLADKAYDTDNIRALAAEAGMEVVIPLKANRRKKIDFDRYLYALRHLVENRFLDFKAWRGIATRYAKRLDSFAAAVEICTLKMWLKIL